MTDEIRINDLAAPVLNDVQRMGLEYGETVTTDWPAASVRPAVPPDSPRSKPDFRSTPATGVPSKNAAFVVATTGVPTMVA